MIVIDIIKYQKGRAFMKRSRKISIVLIVAMVLCISSVVTAYAQYIKTAQYVSSSDRYIQYYEMDTTYNNWKYTTAIASSGNGYGVTKRHSDREFVVECTSNTLTAFPTFYQVYLAYTEVYALSYELSITGAGSDTAAYKYDNLAGQNTCLGIRHDPRSTSSHTNEGIWSPDMY